jgi:CRISPR-associated protein Cmr5
MSKKRIESYIEDALKVLNIQYPNKVIPSAYNGYISAFGASIVQGGLKPTLALFENESAKNKEDKSVLCKNILTVIDDKYEDDSLLRYVVYYKGDEKLLKQKILDVSVALKLCIRTFKLDKGDKDE